MSIKILQLAKNIRNLTGEAVTVYERESQEIIDSNCQKQHRIEHILDGMLDFCFDKDMLVLYKRLCRHYCGIDRNAATKYVYAYRDMWEVKRAQKGQARYKTKRRKAH
jgi:hypothetical protein